MKKKDKKLNKKAAKKAKKNKKNLTVVDKVKNTVASINKDTIVDFAKKNTKALAIAGAVAAVALVGVVSAKSKKRK
jgi:carbonic anhydrase